ncbi:MAG: hypothetical protein AAFO82_11575 [Bacteroidota bacterium]
MKNLEKINLNKFRAVSLTGGQSEKIIGGDTQCITAEIGGMDTSIGVSTSNGRQKDHRDNRDQELYGG